MLYTPGCNDFPTIHGCEPVSAIVILMIAGCMGYMAMVYLPPPVVPQFGWNGRIKTFSEGAYRAFVSFVKRFIHVSDRNGYGQAGMPTIKMRKFSGT